jgi:SAM-dependent methyltransferase
VSGEPRSQAWADFWREDKSVRGGGCLATAGGELAASQSALWGDFALSLPKKARVLDLGTGDGIVLKHMAARRPDLRLTGVDSAPFLPPAKGRMRLQPNVAMEELPFAAGSHDAVVSQFGYEYGDTRRAAAEVRRVLINGGRFLFVVHRSDGPVVAHNQRRAAALRWAAIDSGLLDKARAVATARRTLPLPTPATFAEAVGEAARRFGQDSVAGEIAQAVLQSLGAGFGPQNSLAAIGEIERRAKGELSRLEALAAAARDDAAAAALVEELRAAALNAEPPAMVANRSGEPYAWSLAGRG